MTALQWVRGLFGLGARVVVILIALEISAAFAIVFLGWKAPDVLCKFTGGCRSPIPSPPIVGPDGEKCSVFAGEPICLPPEETLPRAAPHSGGEGPLDGSAPPVNEPKAKPEPEPEPEPEPRSRCGYFDGEIICMKEEA